MNIDKRQRDYYKSFGIKTNTAGFRKYKKAGLLEDVDKTFVKEVKDYWKTHYNQDLDPIVHVAFKNLTGKREPRVAYPKFVSQDIVPFFNDQRRTIVYKDKNIYDKLIPSTRSVVTILKRVHGLYFDQDNNIVDKNNIISLISSFEEDMIVKPSSTNNGEGIRKIHFKDNVLEIDNKEISVDSLEKMYGSDFAVQKIIQQHANMAAPHPSSVNSLRMVTLRWKNEIRYLLTFARFGSENKVQDNAGAGGVCVGVNEYGEFLETAIDEHGMVHTEHPTTGFSFKDLETIPNFDKFIDYVKDLHKEILHHDFVSWDIVVGADGLPVFLEANFRGAVWLYQMASQQPLFGDLTEEVLNHISKERYNKKSSRWKGLASSRNRTSIKTVRNQVKTVKQEKEQLEFEKNQIEVELNKMKENFHKEIEEITKERDKYKKEFDDVKQSKSWRITSPVRKISSIIKRD